jgi:hypothetical protein
MPTLVDMLRDRLTQGDANGWDNPDDEQGCMVCLIAELEQQQDDGKKVDHRVELNRLRARLAKFQPKRPRR